MPKAKKFKAGDIVTIKRGQSVNTSPHIKFGKEHVIRQVNETTGGVFLDRCDTGNIICDCIAEEWMYERFKLVAAKVKITAKELSESHVLPAYDVLEGFLKKSGII